MLTTPVSSQKLPAMKVNKILAQKNLFGFKNRLKENDLCVMVNNYLEDRNLRLPTIMILFFKRHIEDSKAIEGNSSLFRGK